MKKTCIRGKHFKKGNNKKFNKKKLAFIAALLLVVSLLCLMKVLDNEKNQMNNEVSINATQSNLIISNEINVPIAVGYNIPNKIEDYEVIGEIVIDKINVDKYILNKTTNKSLDLSVTKFYGPNANDIGNFCITGHNYEGLFKELRQLEINDTFCIVDKKNYEKVTYKIYDKYTVYPTNLECLNQDTNNKREVTLITCNPRRSN